jgi:hypothetical protein
MNEGQELVYLMLRADDRTKLPGFVVYEAPYPEFADFYFIHAEWDNPWGGSAPLFTTPSSERLAKTCENQDPFANPLKRLTS